MAGLQHRSRAEQAALDRGPCDFARSFVTFVTPDRGNNARLQVESVCTILDGDKATDYLFFASCKAERTYAENDLFVEDNYDFCGIFSDDEYVLFRTHATHTDGFREQGLWRGRFEEVHQHLVRVEGTPLSGNTQIVRATYAHIPLVGRVRLSGDGGRLRAVLEFPIKTMNVNDVKHIYQVDTGPVPFPDLAMETQRHIERLSPAYVAYNAPHFADFVVQRRLPIRAGAVELEVTHYAQRASLPAETGVLTLGCR